MKKIAHFISKERFMNINFGIFEIKLTYTANFFIDLIYKIDIAIISALLLVKFLYN